MSESKNRKSEIEAKKRYIRGVIQERLKMFSEKGIYSYVTYDGEVDKWVKRGFNTLTSLIRMTDPQFPSAGLVKVGRDGRARIRLDEDRNIVTDERVTIPDWDEKGVSVCLLFSIFKLMHFKATDIIDELGKSKEWWLYSTIADDAGYYNGINKCIGDVFARRFKEGEDGEYTDWMTFEEVEKYMKERGLDFVEMPMM